jgi:DNA-binding ferritin-like protein
LRDSIGAAINGAIDATANPLLEKVLPMVFGPLLNTQIQCYKVLAGLVAKAQEECKGSSCTNEREFHWRMRSASWGVYWKTYDIARTELDTMVTALRALGSVPPFNYLYPMGLYYEILESVRQLLRDAMYTIEKDARNIELLAQGGAAVADKIAENYDELVNKYFADSQTQAKETMETMLWMLIGTPILKTVLDAPGVSDAIAAADGMIPDDLKDFLSVNDCVEDVLKGVLADVISHTVENNTESSMAKLQAGFDALAASS